MAFAQSELSY